MEHRCGVRRSIRVAVTLVTSGGREVVGVLRDFSLSGVFVETGEKYWRTFLPVEVRLTSQLLSNRAPECAEAMVVRSTWDGVALMFDPVNPPFIAPLVAIFESVCGTDGTACPARAPGREIEDWLQV